MIENLTESQVQQEISVAVRELQEPDGRAVRFWKQIRINPCLWTQTQYPGFSSFWVIAILGSHCLYFNYVEGGWGWGQFAEWGKINSFHYEQDEIYHVVFKTLLVIGNGETGQPIRVCSPRKMKR